MKLRIEGHSARKGYAISLTWSDAECSKRPPATAKELAPVRFVQDLKTAKALVERWNTRFATH